MTKREIKKVLEARAVEVYGADVEGLAHSLKCLDVEFIGLTDAEAVEKYADLIEEMELVFLTGAVVTVKRDARVPEWLKLVDGVVTKADSKSCIYIDVNGEQFKLHLDDLAVRSRKVVGKRTVNTYRAIEVRSYDNSKHCNRLIEMDLMLPSNRMTRAEAISYAKARQIVKGLELQDIAYQIY